MKGDGNWLPRAILKCINIEESHYRIIREEIVKAIQEHIWEQENLYTLVYKSKEELAQKARQDESLLGYQELAPFAKNTTSNATYIYQTKDTTPQDG